MSAPLPRLVVLVTGAIGSGKTRLLTRVCAAVKRRWQLAGFIARANNRTKDAPPGPASSYALEVIGGWDPLPWAARRASGQGFEFNEATRAAVERAVVGQLATGRPEICVLDEIGPLELSGAGFAELFRAALSSQAGVVVAAVKKSALADVIAGFGIVGAEIVDLDSESAPSALRHVLTKIAACDADQIGAFAGIGGLVEVGLGSTLHVYHVPFAGHLLAYLQNVLLITFGKALAGRGLVRISFITSMLKAFSPAGNVVRPMLYIFAQGAAFAAPVGLLGWNVLAVMLGSVLMAWFMLVMSLTVEYATFGQSIFSAFAGAALTVGRWLGMQDVSLWQAIGAVFVLKAVLAVSVALVAYYADLSPVVRRLSERRRAAAQCRAFVPGTASRKSWAQTAATALRNLLRPRFLILFFFSSLLLLFFTNLTHAGLFGVMVRGLCVSYVGFLLIQHLDVHGLGGWLDRRAHLGLARSLPIALNALGTDPHPEPELGNTLVPPAPPAPQS